MGLLELAAKVNWVDVLILILLLKIGYGGFSKGFSSEAMPFLGTITAFLASLHYYSYFGQFVSSITPLSRPISDLFGFILVTIIIKVLFSIIRTFIMKMIRIEVVSFMEHLGGLVLGAARAALTASLILVILVLIPLGYIDSSIKDRSLLGKDFLKIGPVLYHRLVQISPGIDGSSPETMKSRFTRECWRQ